MLGAFSDEEVDQMTLDLSSLGTVDANIKAAVLDEFYEMAVAKRFVAQGGIDFAKNLLEKSFGSERAFDILNRLQVSFDLKLVSYGFGAGLAGTNADDLING